VSGRVRRYRAIIALTWSVGRWRCAVVVATLFAEVLGTPLFAVLAGRYVDAVLAGRSTAAAWTAADAALAWAFISQARGLRTHLRDDVRDRVGYRVNQEVLQLAARAPRIDHLEDPAALDRLERITNKGQTVADLVWAFAETLALGLTVLFTVVIVSVTTPVLLLSVPVILLTFWLNRRGQQGVREAIGRSAELGRAAEELLALLREPRVAGEVAVNGAAEILLEEYERRSRTASLIVRRAEFRAARMLAGGWALYMLIVGIGLGSVAREIAAGTATAGALVLIMIAARHQQVSVQLGVNGFNRMADGLLTAEAYFWFHDRQQAMTGRKAAEAAGRVPAVLRRGIRLSKVGFRYPGTERTVLDGIDVDLPAGSVVAVVGSHGSGKTSLVKLLSGMYEPSTGSIAVDGTPLSDVDPKQWREHLSVVFQDFSRLNGLAAESVGCGDLPRIADRSRIAAAVERAGASGVVEDLPTGLDSYLGSVFDGPDLSGGQWQRLALARGLMRELPLLVVLDEPTASLDPVSELRVFERQIAASRRWGRAAGTVTVLVSHRFSTVSTADLIVVLDGGRVIESGTHVSLRAAHGRYAQLYDLQYEAYFDDDLSRASQVSAPPVGAEEAAVDG